MSPDDTLHSSTHTPKANSSQCPVCGQAGLCNGLGVISYDVPVGHPDFGKLFRCPNKPAAADHERQQRLRKLSNLAAFQDKTFNTFEVNRPLLTQPQQQSLFLAYNMAQEFAQSPEGWLVLEGTYGCGKTHLAAAVGNTCLARGEMVLFITVPDLLDHLRSTYGPSSEVGYDEMFDRIRSAQLLILDDLGAENQSQWAGEKLFQLLNHRYSQQLPTVITTNVDIDNLDGRIRSRMLDEGLIQRAKISAPDYRTATQNEQNQLTNLAHYREMALDNFDFQTGARPDEQHNLRDILRQVQAYAAQPQGWLVLLGDYGTGKTHLAAAIANVQREQGASVIFTTVPDLMDYLRVAFNNNAAATLQDRFQTVLDAELLVLDDLRSDQSSSWSREKLFQLIEYRYTGKLPTIITSAKTIDDLDKRIVVRLLDRRRCRILALTVRSYVERLQTSGQR